MNWENIGILIGALGGFELIKFLINLFANRKTNSRKNDAEASGAEADADTKEWELEEMRIADLHESFKIVSEQLQTALRNGARKDEIIEDKTAKIRELNDRVFDLQNKLISREQIIAAKDRFIDWLKLWHCSREKTDCDKRKPPQPIPMRYDPPAEMTSPAEITKE